MVNEQFVYVFRIVLAGICGILIGVERKNRSKEAGVRTHFVVACGAALMMVVSKYAFFDVIQDGMFGDVEVRLDPSRVASTIASGIGFLGAGMIFIHKNTITGLTTAAGIWATSGVGMALGSGMYFVGIITTIVILTAQYVLHMELRRKSGFKTMVLSVKNVNTENFQDYMEKWFEEKKINILYTTVERFEDERNYIFKIEITDKVTEDEIITIAGKNSVIKPI